MGLPVVALASFGAYGAATAYYALPGGLVLPAGKVNVPEWIGGLSFVLPLVATVGPAASLSCTRSSLT
jgi:hypothetical protein